MSVQYFKQIIRVRYKLHGYYYKYTVDIFLFCLLLFFQPINSRLNEVRGAKIFGQIDLFEYTETELRNRISRNFHIIDVFSTL